MHQKRSNTNCHGTHCLAPSTTVNVISYLGRFRANKTKAEIRKLIRKFCTKVTASGHTKFYSMLNWHWGPIASKCQI